MSEFSAAILGVSFLFGCLAIAKSIERAMPRKIENLHTTKFIGDKPSGIEFTTHNGATSNFTS
jgi:hypothetical protein